MVDLGEDARKKIQDLGLELAPERVVAPGVAHERRRLALRAVGSEGERERHLAGGACRLLLGEERADHSRRFFLDEKRLFGAPPQGGRDRPIRVVAHETGDAIEADPSAEADRHPFAQGARG